MSINYNTFNYNEEVHANIAHSTLPIFQETKHQLEIPTKPLFFYYNVKDILGVRLFSAYKDERTAIDSWFWLQL